MTVFLHRMMEDLGSLDCLIKTRYSMCAYKYKYNPDTVTKIRAYKYRW